MSGLITAAGIGAGASLLATGANLYGQSQAAGRAGAAQSAAMANAEQQQMLQAMQMQQQREMQIATQTDVNGNKLIYDPQKGWIPLLSPIGLADKNAAQMSKEIERAKYFGRGQYEDTQNFNRRLQEGTEAQKLMDAIKGNVGGPTREGVIGAEKIAGVTKATEPADLIKSGGATANLRSGGSPGALAGQYGAIDKTALTGVRSALAEADRAGPQMFRDQQASWRNNLLSGYDKLASRASNTGNLAMPANSTDALDAAVASRAARPMQVNPYSGYGMNLANNALVSSLTGQKTPDYGAGFAALGVQGEKLFNAIYNSYNKNPQFAMSGTNPGGVGRAGSFGANF